MSDAHPEYLRAIDHCIEAVTWSWYGHDGDICGNLVASLVRLFAGLPHVTSYADLDELLEQVNLDAAVNPICRCSRCPAAEL